MGEAGGGRGRVEMMGLGMRLDMSEGRGERSVYGMRK